MTLAANDQILLVKLNQVVGTLYLPANSTDKAIIHAQGGPSLGDRGKSELWPISRKNNCILFVPDYIGYCRSDGFFNFKNCIETIYESEKYLIDKFNCKEIILIGSSWGAAIAPFIEKYGKSSIRHIGLVKPVTNWKNQGKTKQPEEDVIKTDQEIKTIWKNIYRGYSDSEWPDIFRGKLDEFNPIDNLDLLENKKIYICHGREDDVIYWKKSEEYFYKLKKLFPKSAFFWKAIKGNHDSEFNAKALKLILEKIFDTSLKDC